MLRWIVVLAASVAIAAPARGATVSLTREGEASPGFPVLRVDAHPGEANSLTVGELGAEIVVTDSGAPLTPGTGCRLVGPSTAACGGDQDPNVASLVHAVVLLRDGDDAASFTLRRRLLGDDSGVVSLDVYGGTGDDVISLEAARLGFTRIFGNTGDDRITGNAWVDEIWDGPGGDVVRAGAADDFVWTDAGNDRIDGGTGRDWVSYMEAPRRIVANLAVGVARGWGRDRLTAVEALGGSRFADVLVGDAAGNRLMGMGGDDLLVGKDGRDVLGSSSGEPGADRLVGGPGDDAFFAGSANDVLVGGPGRDGFKAGTGHDRLFARDGVADLRIEAGKGIDAATIDPGLDRPTRVERVF